MKEKTKEYMIIMIAFILLLSSFRDDILTPESNFFIWILQAFIFLVLPVFMLIYLSRKGRRYVVDVIKQMMR